MNQEQKQEREQKQGQEQEQELEQSSERNLDVQCRPFQQQFVHWRVHG